MTHLSVLGLRPISFLDDSELHDWGNESIQRLADFYGNEKEHTYKDPETNTPKTSKSDAVLHPIQLMVIVFILVVYKFKNLTYFWFHSVTALCDIIPL